MSKKLEEKLDKKYYDNGERVLKGRMEDEEWYPDYQRLLEMSMSEEEIKIEDLMETFDNDYLDIFKKQYKNRDQLLRWCTVVVERHYWTLIHLKEEYGSDWMTQ